MAPLKVLIIGAGIAGNALAFWLSKLGHDVTIIERYPNLRTTGLQVDVRGHAIEVMKRMGLEPAFRSNAAPETGLKFVDSKGRPWGYFPANTSGEGLQSFTSDWEIMRGDLCRIMHDAAVDKTKYIFGTSVESLDSNGGPVEVRFTNGKTARFDLVVGADGQGSRTRRMMLGLNNPDGLHMINGHYIGYFTVRRPIQVGEEYIAKMYSAPGGREILTRRHSPNEIQIYLICQSNSPLLKSAQPGNEKEEKEAFTKFFKGAGWETEEILEALQGAEDFYCERLGYVKLDSWSQGQVTLVGDAGYSPGVNGMGTSSAIVGAYILAGEISMWRSTSGDKQGGDDLAMALMQYERKFRPFMDQVQKGITEGVSESPGFFDFDRILSTPFGITIIYCFVAIVSFLRLDIFGKWFLPENVRNWELPEYKDMRDMLQD